MQRRPKVSIITVAYKAQKELFNCLQTLSETKEQIPFEIIVVDNNEKPGLGPRLKRKFPKVKCVRGSGNVGFSAGNNLGAKEAHGEYLFFLNPDTKVLVRALQIVTGFLDSHPKTAIVSPMLLDSKLTPYEFVGTETLTPARAIFGLSFLNKIFPNNPVSRKFWLKDRKKDKSFEVGVVPGSALMIRRTIFNALGGFDENFFLYFEEADLCKRASDAGFKSWILPAAKVVHLWEKSTTKGEKIDRIFAQSRFYYFRKHFGIFSALVVNGVCAFSKWHAILIGIVALGTFLRFYRLSDYIVFHGELGHNYLAIKNFIQARQIPLLGPPTSHPWLSFGPLFYWIFAPVLVLARYNPVSGAYFMAFASTLLIVLNYLFVEKLFDKKIAIISSFLIAISPAFVVLSWESRFFSLVPLIFYPFLYFFVKGLELKNYLFWAGFFFGIMLNFHLSPIILIPPAIILLWLKRKSIKKMEIAKGLLGFIIPNIPFLIFNLQNKFEMLLKLLLWIPYRIAGFAGLYPKNTATSEVVAGSTESLYEFLRLIFTTQKNILAFLVILALLIFVLVKTIKSFQKNKTNSAWVAIVLFFLAGYLGIFIHGNPPSHYYLPLYPIPIIFLAVFISELIAKKSLRWIAYGLLLVLTFLNLKFYFSASRISAPLVPYRLQLKIAQTIIRDAGGEKYSLGRVGYADKFEGNYAQNYQYLLWWMGNEPIDIADIRYMIYEDKFRLPAKIREKVIYKSDGLTVLREKNEEK